MQFTLVRRGYRTSNARISWCVVTVTPGTPVNEIHYIRVEEITI